MYVCMCVGTVQAAPEAVESAKVAVTTSPVTTGSGKGDFGSTRYCMYVYVCMYVYTVCMYCMCVCLVQSRQLVLNIDPGKWCQLFAIYETVIHCQLHSTNTLHTYIHTYISYNANVISGASLRTAPSSAPTACPHKVLVLTRAPHPSARSAHIHTYIHAYIIVLEESYILLRIMTYHSIYNTSIHTYIHTYIHILFILYVHTYIHTFQYLS